MNQKLNQIVITVLDYETTGSVLGYPNEPWQIGLVSLKEGRVDSASLFESFLRVDLDRPFNSHAPGRHALIRKELSESPRPAEIWQQIKSRLTNRSLCAHNVATEKKFVQRMAPMHPFGPWIDTLRLARKAWPDLSSYALEDVILSLDLKSQVEVLLPNRGFHDALYDAVASAVFLEHLLKQPHWQNLTCDAICSL